MLRRLKRETLRERIVQEVKRAIIDGDLKPGDRLPTEMELAESLGVSRSSVREATKALEFIGVLNSSPKNGCTVGSFDMRGVVDQLTFHLEAQRATLEELLDSRFLLEVGIMPMVVKRATEEDLEHLQELVDAMAANMERGIEDVDLDGEFHSTLFKAARNRVLESFSNVVDEFFIQLRKTILGNDEEAQETLRQHREICEALKARDVEKAKAAMTAHLDLVRRRLEKAEEL